MIFHVCSESHKTHFQTQAHSYGPDGKVDHRRGKLIPKTLPVKQRKRKREKGKGSREGVECWHLQRHGGLYGFAQM